MGLVQDLDVRKAHNLLYPVKSKEADQVELDVVETPEVEAPRERTNVKTKVKEKTKSVEVEVDFENLPYFHGEITREDAEKKLQGKPQGTFLTRSVWNSRNKFPN